MIQIKKTLLTLVALLAVTTGAWADELASSYSSNATLNNVTVSANMEVTIASGVTVTINNGLNIASGTLTVKGPGTLVVNGAKGNDGASGIKGGTGGNGGVAISGNIIVQGGATVTATGGNGGNGGWGDMEGGNGGNGGNAFAGTLTYKSGTVTANGGSGGSGGWGEEEERSGSSGSAGKAFANDVDFTQTTGYSVTNGTSTIESVLNQRKVVISGGSEPAEPSAVDITVAWNKAEKTGSFTMPGGNVTLEPDYYPQAALAAAPTAIPDVPATTDGAILSAGTVKKAIDNEMVPDLQGTVMYYAVQVSGDAAPTAPDYDAEGWTEEVPTAANFAQGKVYVWYYIKGADGNGDEYIFSDSEITALGTEGYVTLAAEPTYAVTFADDLAEPTEWTAEPAADVKKGTAVTVTYTGTKKVLGVKAEKKAASLIVNPEVGQVIGSDGKNYDYASLPQGVTAVAKICYVSGSNGLALALTDEEGKMEWSTAIETCTAHTPAITGGTWKLATKDEWDNMINAAGSYEALRDGFSSVGGTNMQSDYYWSSTEADSYRAWDYRFLGGYWFDGIRTIGNVVRACLAF